MFRYPYSNTVSKLTYLSYWCRFVFLFSQKLKNGSTCFWGQKCFFWGVFLRHPRKVVVAVQGSPVSSNTMHYSLVNEPLVLSHYPVLFLKSTSGLPSTDRSYPLGPSSSTEGLSQRVSRVVKIYTTYHPLILIPLFFSPLSYLYSGPLYECPTITKNRQKRGWT